MYCQKCGEENPEGAKFCMNCGADVSGYKVEISPKISVSAKAEGGVALKWKQKPYMHVEIKGYGKLPVYKKFVCLENDVFCPLCGNYGCVCVKAESEIMGASGFYQCSACNKYFCCDDELPGDWF